jgi:hypothetical protein
MKRMLSWWKGLVVLIAVVVFALVIAWLLQTASKETEAGQGLSPIETPAIASPTAPPWQLGPTPIPPDYTPTGPNGEIPTATPYPGEVRPPSVFVTPTPLPISTIVDLAPELPDEEKSVYIISRSDGTYEKFLISVYYAGDVKELTEFGPGDVLLYHYLLKPREATPIVTITAAPTSGMVTETPQNP